MQWGIRHVEHRSLRAFGQFDIRQTSIHTILGYAFPLDIYLSYVPGAPLLVSFHGAAPERKEIELPIFRGVQLALDTNASLLAFSDPALHLSPDLRIGWFAGTREMPLQSILPSVLRIILDQLQPNRVVIIGGSAGGFAAMYYAQYVANSYCTVWNPQTNLLQYDRALVETYVRRAFGLKSRAEIEAQLENNITCDLTTNLAQRDRAFDLLYLQNLTDIHVKNHLKPFLRTIAAHISCDKPRNEAINERTWLFLDNWGIDHAPPPRAFLRQVVGYQLHSKVTENSMSSYRIGAELLEASKLL